MASLLPKGVSRVHKVLWNPGTIISVRGFSTEGVHCRSWARRFHWKLVPQMNCTSLAITSQTNSENTDSNPIVDTHIGGTSVV